MKYKYKIVEVTGDKLQNLKKAVLKSCNNNTFCRNVVEKEFVEGNIFQIMYYKHNSDNTVEGGFLNKQAVEYEDYRGQYRKDEKFNSSFINKHSVLIGNIIIDHSVIHDSIIIGNTSIANSSIESSAVFCQYKPFLLNFTDGNGLKGCDIFESVINDSKILYGIYGNVYCAIVKSSCSMSIVKDSELYNSKILSSVVRDSYIGDAKITKSYARNINTSNNGFKLRFNRVTDNKNILVVGNIGSRNDRTTFVKQKDNIYANVGCFSGTIEELRTNIMKSHFERRDEEPYYDQYMAAIEFAEKIFVIR